jgi:hypothetical protein
MSKAKINIGKVREMQNYSMVFKSNCDYKNILLVFPTYLFPAGAPFSDL